MAKFFIEEHATGIFLVVIPDKYTGVIEKYELSTQKPGAISGFKIDISKKKIEKLYKHARDTTEEAVSDWNLLAGIFGGNTVSWKSIEAIRDLLSTAHLSIYR